MRSIAVLNQKGGVGKTTTSVNTAAALADSGQRVLLIDLDPQCHATLHLGIELTEGERGVYEALTAGVPIAEVARSVNDNLVVLPASLDLVGAELELAETAERETALARALADYQQSFDFVIIDCAPSLGLLSINALAAVNEVIIPLQPHFLALQGPWPTARNRDARPAACSIRRCTSPASCCACTRAARAWHRKSTTT